MCGTLVLKSDTRQGKHLTGGFCLTDNRVLLVFLQPSDWQETHETGIKVNSLSYLWGGCGRRCKFYLTPFHCHKRQKSNSHPVIMGLAGQINTMNPTVVKSIHNLIWIPVWEPTEQHPATDSIVWFPACKRSPELRRFCLSLVCRKRRVHDTTLSLKCARQQTGTNLSSLTCTVQQQQ